MRTILVVPFRWLTRGWPGALTLSLLAAVTIAACGGGGSDSAAVGSGGTGSFSVGTITGFGSVIVNGQRYEDAGASVSDEEGPRSRSDLRLGMVVTVQGSISDSGSATASSIVFDSDLLGPVDVGSINTGNNTFAVLGQKVVVTAATVFDAALPRGLAGLRAGQTVEVYGFLNPVANELQASLVQPGSAPDKYKISGNVSGLDSGARTFQIGSATVSYAGVSGPDVPPANGVFAKVKLSTVAAGARQATGLRLNNVVAADRQNAEVEGLVAAFASPAQFSVGSVRVDARNASFPNGTTGLGLGARVEVKGALVAGILLASQVKVPDPKAEKQIELRGSVSAFDSAAKTFVVRGVVVSYASAVQFEKGGLADLRNGARIEVKGRISTNSAMVIATRIEFSD